MIHDIGVCLTIEVVALVVLLQVCFLLFMLAAGLHLRNNREG